MNELENDFRNNSNVSQIIFKKLKNRTIRVASTLQHSSAGSKISLIDYK